MDNPEAKPSIDNSSGKYQEWLNQLESNVKTLVDGAKENDSEAKQSIENLSKSMDNTFYHGLLEHVLDDASSFDQLKSILVKPLNNAKEDINKANNVDEESKDFVRNFLQAQIQLIDNLKIDSNNFNRENAHKALDAALKESGLLGLSTEKKDKEPEFPKLGLDLELEGIEGPSESGKGADKFWSGLVKEKPENDPKIDEDKKLYKTVDIINDYLNKIGVFLKNENLKDNEELGGTKTLLENVKNVIDNATEVNVRKLQDFISSNLKLEDKKLFEEASLRNDKTFDGKFGEGTLKGLNLVLNNVGEYLSKMEDTLDKLQQQEQEQTAEPDKPEADQGSNQQTPDKPEASVDKPPQAVESLKLGDGEHKPILINGGLEGATFYSINVGNEKMFRELENGDLECYMKIGDNLYEARFDQYGYLCPVATLIDDINGARRNVLIGKNLSCIRYLNNKIPEEIKQYCRIGWAGNTQDYTLESTNCGKRLTIEPMTIAGNGLISKDLPRSLGFLHLANCLRSGVVSGGLKDADVNRKLKVKNVRDSEGNKISIKKENYGLARATSDELAAFKRYNNPETWKNHASINGNKNNQYRKIGLPFEPKLDFNSAKYIETSGIVPESSDDSGSITKTIETGDGKLNVSVENVVKSNTGEGKSAEKIRSVSDIKAELGDIDYNNLNFEDFQDGVEVSGIQKLGIRMDGFGFREFNGNVIIGKWVDGGISEGVVLRKNGDKYIGGLAGGDNYTVNGEPAVIRHGNGEMKYADGAEYNGEFKNGAIFTGVFEHEGIKLDLHDGKLVGENGEKLTQVVNGNGVEYRLKQLCEWLKDVKSVDGNFLGYSIVLNKIDGTRQGIHFEDRSFGDERILAGWMNDYIEKHKNES